MSDETPEHPDHESENEGGVAVKERPKTEPSKPRLDHLPPWRVLLHNDHHNTFDHVIRSIRELTSLDRHQAITRTFEAHTSGVALLMVTHQERAELIRDQFKTKRLMVSIEPMD